MSQLNDYQFLMIPQQLTSCLDAKCGKMLTTLLGLSSLLKNEDGWFYRSNKDLQLDTRLSENVIRATLDTLYQAGIIDVDCIGKGRGHRTNRIHINFESFKVYQQYSFNEIRNNPDLWIDTVPYKDHFVPSYMKKSEDICESKCEGLCECICEKVSTNTYTTDISNTSDTKEKNIIYKEENMKVIPKEEKDNIYNDNERNLINIENPAEIKKDIDTLNIEDSEDDSIFFKEFLDNPSKDYSGLLGDVTSFVKMNITELNILNHKLTEYHNQEPSANYVLKNLQYYYQEKISKAYQEVTQPA